MSVLLSIALVLPSQPTIARRWSPEDDGNIVLVANEAALSLIRAERVPPPVAARALAMTHAAVYDAVNAVRRTHAPFLVDTAAPPGTSESAAGAVAAYRVLAGLFPAREATIAPVFEAWLTRLPEAGRAQGVAVGRTVGDEVLRLRRDDGSKASVSARITEGPGAWRPTPPGFRAALAPQWSGVRPFAVGSPEDFRPGPPPELTSREYAEAFNEVRALGRRDSFVRTAEQTQVARFWAAGPGTATPPGYWNRAAQAVARERSLSPSETARLFALLNAALADAGICCWECKYRHALWRPVTAIREADRDDNPDTAPDPAWEPLLETPPFPAYSSGHSSFSAAAAAVLADFLGTDAVALELDADDLPGVTRRFTSLRAAAEEAGRSRIYGGIHYEFDNRAGLSTGKAIGEYVSRTLMRPLAAEGR